MAENKYTHGLVETGKPVIDKAINGFTVNVLDGTAPRGAQLIAEVYSASEVGALDRAHLVAEAFNVMLIDRRTPTQLFSLVNLLAAILFRAQDWMRADFDACRTPADMWHARNQVIDEALKLWHAKTDRGSDKTPDCKEADILMLRTACIVARASDSFVRLNPAAQRMIIEALEQTEPH